MRCLALVLLLQVAVCSRAADADDATLRKILTTASAWSSSGQERKGFDPVTRRQLDELAAKVADPSLRDRARKLVAELEPACVLQVRVRFLLGEVKRLKGKAVT